MFTQKYKTGREYAPEFELYLPEKNNSKGIYRARYKVLWREFDFSTRASNLNKAVERAEWRILQDYREITNPPTPDNLTETEIEELSREVFDKEMARAFRKVELKSELNILGGILQAMIKNGLKTSEAEVAFSRAKVDLGLGLEVWLPNDLTKESVKSSDDDRAQDIFDRELAKACLKVSRRSELKILSDIIDALFENQLRTYESVETYLKAKTYLFEKEQTENKRDNNSRN